MKKMPRRKDTVKKKNQRSQKKKTLRRILLLSVALLFVTGFVLWASRAENLRSLKDSFRRMVWSVKNREQRTYNAKSLLVIDRKNNEAFVQKVEKEALPPASLAKLFSVCYASEKLDLDEKIPVTAEALAHVKKGSSVARLEAGEVYTLHDLFAAMLVPSGNDAAYVLADFLGGKDHPQAKTSEERIQSYLTDLNDYIQKREWTRTKIYDPSGYDFKGSTCAQDLKGVSDLLLTKDWFRKIVCQARYTAQRVDGGSKSWVNTNHFLRSEDSNYNPRVMGIKTGSLGQDYNIVVLYVSGEKEYLIISLGSETDQSRYEDVNVLLKSIDESPFLKKK